VFKHVADGSSDAGWAPVSSGSRPTTEPLPTQWRGCAGFEDGGDEGLLRNLVLASLNP